MGAAGGIPGRNQSNIAWLALLLTRAGILRLSQLQNESTLKSALKAALRKMGLINDSRSHLCRLQSAIAEMDLMSTAGRPQFVQSDPHRGLERRVHLHARRGARRWLLGTRR